MQPGVMEERPPFVTFERRAVMKYRLAPPAGDGTPYYEDIDFAIITPQGSKDKIEKEVLAWFSYLEVMTKDRRYNPEWLKAFKAMYQAWKEERTIPLNGHPIMNWPVASPAEMKRCTELHLMTVEDLAAANEEAISRLGMGGRSLKQRAVDWITAQKGTAPLISALDAARITLETTTRKLEDLQAENRDLKAQNEQYRMREVGVQMIQSPPPTSLAPLEDRLAAAQAAVGADDVNFEGLTPL